MSQMPRPQHPSMQLEKLQKEALEILSGTVNGRFGGGIENMSRHSQNIPVARKAFFEDNLAEEAT